MVIKSQKEVYFVLKICDDGVHVFFDHFIKVYMLWEICRIIVCRTKIDNTTISTFYCMPDNSMVTKISIYTNHNTLNLYTHIRKVSKWIEELEESHLVD